jgi:predicted MFS family arabinose efflux permease
LALVVAVAQGSLALALVFHARDTLGASKAQTGCLAGIWPLFYMVSCHLSRPLTRRLRPRHCILGATLVLAVLACALGMSRQLYLAFALNALLGTTTALFWPPMMGWLATNAEGTQLNRRLSIFNLCWSTGAIMSPVLAGWASERASVLPLYISSGLFLAGFAGIATAIAFLPGIGGDDGAHDEERNPSATVRSGTPLRYPAWLGLFASYLILGVLLNVFPMAGRSDWGLRNRDVGLLLFCRALSTSAAFVLLGRMKWWHFKGWQMVASTMCLGATLFALAMSRTMAMMAVAMLASGVFTALCYVNSLFHGAAESSHRVARMAIHESLLSAGLCVGASLGGVAYGRFGVVRLLVGSASALAAASLLQAALLAAMRRRSHGAQASLAST